MNYARLAPQTAISFTSILKKKSTLIQFTKIHYINYYVVNERSHLKLVQNRLKQGTPITRLGKASKSSFIEF